MQLLSNDSRLSYRKIAKKLGISHANVSAKIRRYEDHNVIRGYTIVLDPEQLDLYSLCLRISVRSGADLSAIGRRVADFDHVSIVLRVSGDCDLLVLAACKNRQEAISLISDISGVQGIDKVESHVVLETLKIAGKKLKD